MGVTIHYRGRLRRSTDIQSITLKIKDLCQSAGWSHQLVGTEPDQADGLQGIHFQAHPRCESIWMTFDRAGVLHNPVSFDDPDPQLRDKNGLPYLSTKTQFAGPETHVLVCKLLRYLADKYCDVFIVLDEGRYYETGRLRYLTEAMDYLDDVIRDLSESLEILPGREGESLEEQILGIARRFRERRKPPEQ